MYRYGDGTPFPLDENFIETLTSAVETCTEAFMPLTELDGRRERAREARREGEREAARLEDMDRSITAALAPYMPADKKPATGTSTPMVAQKVAASAKQAIMEAKRQIDQRVHAAEAQASPRTAGDDVLKALAPFFDEHQLPKTQWIMSWDVRGHEPAADAIATAGRITAAFALSPEPYRGPIRVGQLADHVIVHMMKRGVFGKGRPAPVDLSKYVMVAFERTAVDSVVTLKENATRSAAGLRFAVSDTGATWTMIGASGDAEGDTNPLDLDDVGAIRQLADRAHAALKDLTMRRSLVDLSLGGTSVSDLDDPRALPMELLAQLTPLARTIRERSRMSGELILKRDIGDGRREELFVPRATLAQQYARLPAEYRRPFEDMGITGEATQPAIMLPRPPGPPPAPTGAKRPSNTFSDETTVEVDKD